MKLTSTVENKKTIASIMGISEEEAENLLDTSVLLTFADNDLPAVEFAKVLDALLQRTVSTVATACDMNFTPDIEVVIGKAKPCERIYAKHLYVNIYQHRVVITETRVENNSADMLYPSLNLIGACYAAAKILATVLGEKFPYKVDEPLDIDFKEMFGKNIEYTHEPVNLGTMYMAGAGAVGNAFLYCLQFFDVSGKIHVVDPKNVKAGNLNRCMFFSEPYIELPKAQVLCHKAQPLFKKLELVPRVCEVRELPEKNQAPYIERLIVTVDSRRARRKLQKEIPREVFDASTTGIHEVVFHFNSQPLNDMACLSCIYELEGEEVTREMHIAETLRISTDKVRELFIDEEAASQIARHYPDLVPEQIIGTAYDSLFKQLCGQGQLMTPEDKQVLAPFAFVSVLAGAVLALEMVLRQSYKTTLSSHNFWKLTPYNAPVLRGKRVRKRIDGCEFCSNQEYINAASILWEI